MPKETTNVNSAAMHYYRDGPHKAAVSLNNAAVSLISRGHYQDAVSTLEDAVVLMGSAMMRAEHPTIGIRDTSEDDLQAALDRSALRTSLASLVAPLPGDMQICALQEITSMLNPTRVYETLTSCADAASVKVAFPMKIDPIEFERCTMDDVNFEAGVVLYNYGIAHDCLAAAAAVHTNDIFLQARMRSQAHHYYKCARLVLFKIDQDSCQNAPLGLASQMLLLRTVLTHNLLNVSIQLNLQDEYNEYCHAMLILLHFVEAQHAFLPIEDRNIAAAA